MVATLVNLIWLMGCFGEPELKSGSSEKNDIILVSIDTLRADHLAVYGYERQTAPFIDSLAKSGTRFAWARSASPWTLPAHTTMLSGQLPAQHKVVDDTVSLSKDVPVLPELLQASGWNTGGFVSTLYVSRVFGFQRGFDQFEDFDLHTEKRNLAGEVVAEDVIDEALDWWAEQPAGEAAFLFLHFYDVHYAYDPPAPYSTAFDRAPESDDPRYKNYFHFKKKPLTDAQFEHQIAQYDEALLYVDAQLRRLQDAAEKAGRNVQWIITSDHGEEFGERGSWGHAHTLYAEQLHIPLIFSGDKIPTATVESAWASNHDIAPTIAGLAGVKGLFSDGLDLMQYTANPLPDRQLLGETTRFKTNRLSLTEGEYRLEWDLKKNKVELFRPIDDPKEKNDLSRLEPEALKIMKQHAEDALGETWTVSQNGWIELDGAVMLKDGRKTKKVNVNAGDRFVVLPYDSTINFGQSGQKLLGPFQTIGGAAPKSDAPIERLVSELANEVELDEKTRQMLETLGYMQKEDE